MIVALDFARTQTLRDGRTVRRPVFRRRSSLPVSAACVVANGVRQALSHLLARELDVELIEPSVPDLPERRILVDGATIVRVRGSLCDGFVIVRSSDAANLVSLAFGEAERPALAPLSEIERTTLDRLLLALVPLCNALCGTLGPYRSEIPERAASEIQTYLEVRIAGGIPLAIGFALSQDPPEEVVDRLSLDDLREVELEGVVDAAHGRIGVPAFSKIAPGTTLALDVPMSAPGELRFGGVVVGRGVCGVKNGRTAIVLDAAPPFPRRADATSRAPASAPGLLVSAPPGEREASR